MLGVSNDINKYREEKEKEEERETEGTASNPLYITRTGIPRREKKGDYLAYWKGFKETPAWTAVQSFRQNAYKNTGTIVSWE